MLSTGEISYHTTSAVGGAGRLAARDWLLRTPGDIPRAAISARLRLSITITYAQ